MNRVKTEIIQKIAINNWIIYDKDNNKIDLSDNIRTIDNFIETYDTYC